MRILTLTNFNIAMHHTLLMRGLQHVCQHALMYPESNVAEATVGFASVNGDESSGAG